MKQHKFERAGLGSCENILSTNLPKCIAEEIGTKGFSIIRGDTIREHIYSDRALFKEFRGSWNDLRIDKYMNDGGKYRQRRYSVFNYDLHSQKIIKKTDEPHFQEKNINYLNGGQKRYFAGIEDRIKNNESLLNSIRFGIDVLKYIGKINSWHIECHQFRIIAAPDLNGFPTPEGIHRDGVDYTFILLIGKRNITGGESRIYDNNKNHIISYMMEKPLDCALLDDTRTMHEVSPIICNSKGEESYRDTLVITLKNL